MRLSRDQRDRKRKTSRKSSLVHLANALEQGKVASQLACFTDCGTYETAGWQWEMDCPCGSHFVSEDARMRLWGSFSREEAARIFHILSPIMCARMD